MTEPILAQRGRLITDENSRRRTLGGIWMQELTKRLTDAEREALAQALALLLERSDLAACGPRGPDR
jgi:hypothetical protein